MRENVFYLEFRRYEDRRERGVMLTICNRKLVAGINSVGASVKG